MLGFNLHDRRNISSNPLIVSVIYVQYVEDLNHYNQAKISLSQGMLRNEFIPMKAPYTIYLQPRLLGIDSK